MPKRTSSAVCSDMMFCMLAATSSTRLAGLTPRLSSPSMTSLIMTRSCSDSSLSLPATSAVISRALLISTFIWRMARPSSVLIGFMPTLSSTLLATSATARYALAPAPSLMRPSSSRPRNHESVARLLRITPPNWKAAPASASARSAASASAAFTRASPNCSLKDGAAVASAGRALMMPIISSLVGLRTSSSPSVRVTTLGTMRWMLRGKTRCSLDGPMNLTGTSEFSTTAVPCSRLM